MDMGTLLRDAKMYYPFFFKDGQFSKELAEQNLEGLENLKARIEVIKRVYKVVLCSERSTKVIKKYVTNNLSIQEVADILGLNVNTAKSELAYFNKTIGSALSLDDESLLRVSITNRNIDKETWKRIKEIWNKFNINMGEKLFHGRRLVENKELLINIPKQCAVLTEVGEADFNDFINMIRPYFISQRAQVQRAVNNSAVAGYFNYIMCPTISVTGIDLKRRNMVLELFGRKESSGNVPVSVDEPENKVDISTESKSVAYTTRRVQF